MAFRKLTSAFGGTIRRKLKALRREKPRHFEVVDDSEPGIGLAEKIHAKQGWMDSLDESQEDTGKCQDRDGGGEKAKVNCNGGYDSRLPRATSFSDIKQHGKTENGSAANADETEQPNIPLGRLRVASERIEAQERPHGNGMELLSILPFALPSTLPAVLPSVAERKNTIIQHLNSERNIPDTKELLKPQGSLRSSNSTRKVTTSTLSGLPEEDSAASPEIHSVVIEVVGEDT